MEEVMPKAEATLKYARISSRKVKIVADLIRGKKIDEALAIVKYVPKASSEIIEKLLKSAIANAENNHHMAHENVYKRQKKNKPYNNRFKRIKLRRRMFTKWDKKWIQMD